MHSSALVTLFQTRECGTISLQQLKKCLVTLACGLSQMQINALIDIAPLDDDGEVVIALSACFLFLPRPHAACSGQNYGIR